MIILGISCWYHDSAAAIIIDGSIKFAAQEERYTRKKHDQTFPLNAILESFKELNLKANDIDAVVFYEKPFLKFDRLLENYLAFAPKGFKSFFKAIPLWVSNKIYHRINLVKQLERIDSNAIWDKKIKFSEHHLSHAASAFYPSPFNSAAVVTLDGVGEWVTTSISYGKNSELIRLKEIQYPHSIGLLYSAVTEYCGFKVNSGEYKLMGLAPYGKPIYTDLILNNLIKIYEDGSYKLNMKYFGFATGVRMTNDHFHKLFNGPPRLSEAEISQKIMDLAASVQVVTELVVLGIVRKAQELTGEKKICLAGGVALNCVANGKISSAIGSDNLWIQPASGDAGCSIGAALAYYYSVSKEKRIVKKANDSMQGAYLGTSYSNSEIRKTLDKKGAVYSEIIESELIEFVARKISEGSAVGWFQGRMEFGPRSLGNRSILGDPRSANTQKELNLKIKFRESFRPFAPSVLADRVREWFEIESLSPYMLIVCNVKKDKLIASELNGKNGLAKVNEIRSLVPAITHIDNSARVQTVSKETNNKFYNLIQEFYKITGCPMLVNSSFNIRGEPIVCNAEDAYRCFMGTGLDILVIENFILLKNEQTEIEQDYRDNFELD